MQRCLRATHSYKQEKKRNIFPVLTHKPYQMCKQLCFFLEQNRASMHAQNRPVFTNLYTEKKSYNELSPMLLLYSRKHRCYTQHTYKME